MINGQPQWNTLSGSSVIPASLYLESAPDFWPANLAWPPYGHDVSGSASNKIPAQIRYEEIIGIDDPGGENQPPSIQIDSPFDGANFTQNTDILFEVTASDEDGSVIGVDFYREGIFMGSDNVAPYEYLWESPLAGSHIWTAVAIDNLGVSSVSNEVAISVESEDDGGNNDVYITGVSASDSREDAGPANTLDGDLFTRWAAHGSGQWIQYTFSGNASLSSIGIAWRKGDSRIAYFDVSASTDGENWEPVLTDAQSSGASTFLEYFQFNETVDARHIKITGYGTSSNAWNVISEVELELSPSLIRELGDVTSDGTISALDASLALQHAVGNETLSGDALIAADVSGNGSVSALDASLILQYVASLISCFPAISTCEVTSNLSNL